VSRFQEFKEGLGRAFESLHEGWEQLRRRAAHAMTRFRRAEQPENPGELDAPQWGLLAAELHERNDELVLRLEIPGMERDAFDIHVDDRMLTISGEKRLQREEKQGRYQIMECAYGRFERRIPLSCPVDADKARAEYRRGVLTVRLPRQSPRHGHSIPVRGA